MIYEGVAQALRDVPEHPPADIAPEVGGFTSSTIRWFLNRLGALAVEVGGAYVEVGSFKGATLLSAMHGNEIPEVVAFENFSETFGESSDDIRGQLLKNLATHIKCGNFRIIFQDFFEVSWKTERPVVVFFYDGNHSREAHEKALLRIWGHTAPTFVYVVDDWDWEATRAGTYAALATLRPASYTFWGRTDQVRQPGHDVARWHNGLGIFVIGKVTP